MGRILLTRGHGFEMGTPGKLAVPAVPDAPTFVTMERPWKDNMVYVSCIPPGIYPLRKRTSEVVRRASNGQYARGWEVCDVPGRTYIMIHPGNSIEDTEGCILPGEYFSAWDGRWTVTNSRGAFHVLMDALSSRDEWEIDVRYFDPEHP